MAAAEVVGRLEVGVADRSVVVVVLLLWWWWLLVVVVVVEDGVETDLELVVVVEVGVEVEVLARGVGAWSVLVEFRGWGVPGEESGFESESESESESSSQPISSTGERAAPESSGRISI